MNSYIARILVGCCLVAAVAATVYRIGMDSGRREQELNVMQKTNSVGDEAAGSDSAAPQLFADYPDSNRPLLSGVSGDSQLTQFILDRQLDTNDVETMWKSKLIREQDLKEEDF